MNSVLRSRLIPVGRRFLNTTRPRNAAAGEPTEVHPGYKKVKDLQKKFQEDNGLLIHQRGGTPDKVLFGATLALTALVIGSSLEFFYSLAYKGR